MKKKIISSSLLIVGFLIGATALSAVAGTWTAPGANCTPPNCNVDAPVNVGTSAQTKVGKLTIGSAWDTLWGPQPNFFSSTAYITSLGVENLVVATGTPGVGKALVDVTGGGVVGWGDVDNSSVSSYDFSCANTQSRAVQGYIRWNVCAKVDQETGTISGVQQYVNDAGTGTSHSEPSIFTVPSNLNITGPGMYSIFMDEYFNSESSKFKICIMNGNGQSKCSVGTVDNGGVMNNAWVSITPPF